SDGEGPRRPRPAAPGRDPMNGLRDTRAMLAAAMSEAELQDAIVAAARLHGWATYHTRDSRGSDRGFPDLVLVHPRHGVYFAELKSASGRVTADQRAWLDQLRRAGAHTFLWRPEHL